MKLNYTTLVYLGAIVILCGVLCMEKCRADKAIAQYQLQQVVLGDSLEITTNALGAQTGRINNISAEYSQFKQLMFAERDSLAKQLQKIVNKRTIAASIATIQVHVDTLIKTDSVYYGSEDSCKPTYAVVLTDDYQHGHIVASADSFDINLTYPARIENKTETSRWKLFKPQRSVSTLSIDNPYVQITGYRSYTVSCDCTKKAWISFAAGGALGTGLGFGIGYAYKALK
jgi:hypothetical protein